MVSVKLKTKHIKVKRVSSLEDDPYYDLYLKIDSFVDNLKDRGWGALQTYAWQNQESRAYLHVFDVGSEQNEENYLNMMFYALICFYWYLIGFKQFYSQYLHKKWHCFDILWR